MPEWTGYDEKIKELWDSWKAGDLEDDVIETTDEVKDTMEHGHIEL